MKVYYLILAALAVIVLGFAIPGNIDYFVHRNWEWNTTNFFTNVTTNYKTDQKIGLWKMKTQLKTPDADGKWEHVLPFSPLEQKIHQVQNKSEADLFQNVTCKAFVDKIKAASAFGILTCIFAFFTIVAAAIQNPASFATGILTMLCSLITWVLMVVVRNHPHCADELGTPLHLDNKTAAQNANGIYEYYHGFYFFLVPWCVFLLALLAALAMKAGDGGEKTETTTVTKTVVVTSDGEKTETTTTETTKTEEKKEENPLEKKPAEEPKKEEPVEEAKKEEEPKKEEETTRAAAAEEEPTAVAAEEEPVAVAAEEDKKDDEEAELARKMNEEDVERRKKIWAGLKERLPTDRADKDQKRRRYELFEEFDRGEKKYLTPEDLDVGCKNVLGLGQLKKGLAHILPIAHANAREANQANGKAKTVAEENVERCEFRLVLQNIKDHFDLWFMFDGLDVANNSAITPDEFERGIPEIKEWGRDVEDPKAEFEKANTAGNGKISFTEFCKWARANKLEDSGDETDNEATRDLPDEDEARRLNREDVQRRMKIWEDLKDRLPTNKASKEQRMRRFQYFREFDTNSNGFLTLADVQEGCSTVLGLGQLGKGLKHLLPLAHNSARGVANVKGQNSEADLHVEKSEMRLLFVYIHQYFDLWFLFDTLDVANSGSISFEEFAEGVHNVEEWAGVKIEDPRAEFDEADSGKTGSLIFLEFCEWAHHKNTKDE